MRSSNRSLRMAENKAATFEASLKRLEEIVAALEGDAVSLDRSVELFQEGRALARRCEAMLRTAQETIDSAVAGAAAAGAPAADAEALDDDVSF